MKKHKLLLLCLFIVLTAIGQTNDIKGPETIFPYAPQNNEVDENTDFTVLVAPSGTTQTKTLFSYTTYVNKEGYFDSNGDGTNDGNYQKSSFVNFDFTGSIDVQVICNFTNIIPNTVKIRPLDKQIPFSVSGDTINFTLHNAANLSVEINNDRYRNIHVFANSPGPEKPTDPNTYHSVDYMMANLEPALGTSGPDLYFYPHDPKHGGKKKIWIGGNEVFKGGIWLAFEDDFIIEGRGVIDNTELEKNYIAQNSSFQYGVQGIKLTHNPDNVLIDGIIVNDPGGNCIKFTDVNGGEIRNVKTIARVIYGAGIRLDHVNDILIDNCFLRTSDDSIAIYAKPECTNCTPEEQNTTNITVQNTSLYADKAHPIAIGWEGTSTENLVTNPIVKDIFFNNIDILEHEDEQAYFQGAIGIHCGENNNCVNFVFDDIRIEPFTNGSLLNVIVEPQTDVPTNTVVSDGYRIQNIKFKNIDYLRPEIGNTEGMSNIKGILDSISSQCRYVNGVHFDGLEIDGVPIVNPNQYNKFNIGPQAFDVTFYETQYNASFTAGKYYIKNVYDDEYLNPSTVTLPQNPNKYHVRSAPWTSQWDIQKINPGSDLYTIKNVSTGKFLSGTIFENYVAGNAPYCHGNFVVTEDDQNYDPARLHWRIVKVDNDNSKLRFINEWMGRSSLTHTSIDMPNSNHEYVGVAPWQHFDRQIWELEAPGPTFFTDQSNKLFPVPNQANNFFQVDYRKLPTGKYSLTLYDLYSNEIVHNECSNELVEINTSKLAEGIYILHLFDGQETSIQKLLVKH